MYDIWEGEILHRLNLHLEREGFQKIDLEKLTLEPLPIVSRKNTKPQGNIRDSGVFFMDNYYLCVFSGTHLERAIKRYLKQK